MAQFSFDVVSEYNKAEINNAVDQTKREISNRYDFKGTPAAIEWQDNEKQAVIIIGSSQYQIDSILDILRKKLASRGESQKVLDTSKEPITNNLQTRQEVRFKKGLNQEKCKKISKIIKEKLPKVKTQIHGETIRISSSSKDELQKVITTLKDYDFDYPLNFTNYR